MRDFTMHYDAPGSQAAVIGILQTELSTLGARLAASRAATAAELERLAAFRWLTELAGLRPTEVAERTGVSRQTLANLSAGERGEDWEWPVDLRVLLELGLRGSRSTADLVADIARPPTHQFEVEQAVERLATEELVATAAKVAGGGQAWRVTPRGIETLPRRLRHAAMPPSRTWTAYVASSPGEANAIAEAGERALGHLTAMVIPAHTVHGMLRPEVAFTVEAAGEQEAALEAARHFRELRARAGMTEREQPVVVTLLLPPRHPAGG